jgi:dissimilatory sulfite reductase (desulfoviridin) alpha/beta subunit
MAEDGQKAPPGAGDDTLELDLPPAEEARASVPLGPGPQKDSTLTLEEAPLPLGAGLSSDGALEPLLAAFEEPFGEAPGTTLPPPFLARLARAGGPGGRPPKAVAKKEGPLTWSVSVGDAWPVFVRRHVLARPLRASQVREIALAARRYAANRLALTPQGALDILFNDRASLGKAAGDLGSLGRELKGGVPASVASCRGLLLCPYAAADTLGAEAALLSSLRAGESGPGRAIAWISIHGCPSGGGGLCGVHSFTDFRLVGARDRPPLLDQGALRLSPHIRRLVSDCPGGALSEPPGGGDVLALDPGSCTRCGLCLATDPSFSWPEPQGGHFRLELSGRRKALGPGAFVAPRVLVPRVSGNEGEVFDRLAGLLALWRKEGHKDEIVADFVDRRGLGGYFSDL